MDEKTTEDVIKMIKNHIDKFDSIFLIGIGTINDKKEMNFTCHGDIRDIISGLVQVALKQPDIKEIINNVYLITIYDKLNKNLN